MPAFRCIACGNDACEKGVLSAKGVQQVVFTPDDSSRWYRWTAHGADVRALACRSCGLIQMFADVEKLDKLTGEGETRCRKCRHILKGITEPRCPECGERI